MILSQRYELFVFDLDGTLIDSRADIAAAANATLVAFDRPALSERQVADLVGAGVHQLIRDLFAAGGDTIEGDRLEAAYHFFMDDYGKRCTDQTVFYAGVDACLTKLAGKSRAVLTNKPEAFSLEILSALGHADTFHPVIGGDHHLGKKPAPQGLQFIMDTLGHPPARTLMIGDSHIDVATAKAAGCDSLVILGGFGRETDLRHADPTWVVQDIEELVTRL